MTCTPPRGKPLRFADLARKSRPKSQTWLLTGWSPAPNSMLCLAQGSIGLHNERLRDFRRLHSLRIAGGFFDLHDLSCRSNFRASRTQLQKLGLDCRDSYRAAGTSTAVS